MTRSYRAIDLAVYAYLRVIDRDLPAKYQVPPLLGVPVFIRKTKITRLIGLYEILLAERDRDNRHLRQELRRQSEEITDLRRALDARSQ